MIRYYAGDTSTLQKAVSCSVKDELKEKGKINFGNTVSFTHKITNSHREFGDCVLTVDRTKICKRYKCIDVEYSLDFMKRHPDICLKVTACKGYRGLLENAKKNFYDCTGEQFTGDKYKLEEMAENDLESLYGWEDEVIVKGNPIIIKEDDVISINAFPSW
jgi:hypothetical protein